VTSSLPSASTISAAAAAAWLHPLRRRSASAGTHSQTSRRVLFGLGRQRLTSLSASQLHSCTNHTHTQLHRVWVTQNNTPLNGPLSGTTWVRRYQKGKTNLDFTGARDSEWQWHQLGHMQVSTSLQTDNDASTPPLRFLQAGCPSCRPTNSVKALKAEQTGLFTFVVHVL